MKLRPLYRVRFRYRESWRVDLEGTLGTERMMFLLAEGECEGRIKGRFHASNFPRRRVDRHFIPRVAGAIDTDDGAVILCEYQGFGRPEPAGRREVVLSATHWTDHANYRFLNDAVCVGAGEVRAEGTDEKRGQTTIVIDFSELVWEPIAP